MLAYIYAAKLAMSKKVRESISEAILMMAFLPVRPCAKVVVTIIKHLRRY